MTTDPSTPLRMKVALVLLGFVMAGCLSEGVVRMFLPDWGPRTGEISLFWTHDDALGWFHRPNAKGAFNAFGRETLISINSKGFRDLERRYDRDPSKYRIAVLGDSMVWGYGVEREEIFTALLEKAHRGIEVINLGVSGYGTDQELILLQRDAVRYRPDLIVVVFASNDFQTNVQKTAYLIYQKPMFELAGNGDLKLTNTPVPRPGFWLRVGSALIRHSYVVNKAASTYHSFTLSSGTRAPATGTAVKDPVFPRSLTERVTVAMLSEMQTVAERANAELFLVLADGTGRRGRAMETLFGARHVRILNLDPDFPEKDPTAFHLPDGVHWNVAGHRRVADRLWKYLEDEKLAEVRKAAQGRTQREALRPLLAGSARTDS